MSYIDENLKTPFLGDYDLIVAGGGVAGVCAAVAARRAGLDRVLLIEKSILLGGLATQGLIALYEPLCDGEGKKLSYGLASELMGLAIRYSPQDLPELWKEDPDEVEGEGRYESYFSPWIFALVLDELVAEEGIDLIFDTSVVKTLMEGNSCSGIVVENIDGRGYYSARAFVDATGDAFLFKDAGASCIDGDNYLTYIAYRSDLESLERAGITENLLDSRLWYKIGAGPRGNGHPEGMGLFRGTSARAITDFVLLGRSMLLERLKDDHPLKRDLSSIPTMPQFRTVRRIKGHYTLGEEDVNRRQGDSVGVVADFSEAGLWYEIPYRSLIDRIDNMWSVGRSIAARDWAWTAIRVIPGVASSGQAAGLAAALCIKEGYSAQDLPYKLLEEKLKESGVRVHVEEK